MVFAGEHVDGSKGRLFCSLRLPVEAFRGPAVLVVPAFGDEMNKTRRMLTVMGRRLNMAGIGLINPDLSGTGDSEGRFVDASWDQWLIDLQEIENWALRERIDVVGLVGVRTGALLAGQFAKTRNRAPLATTVLWQPVDQGDTFVKQMLRLRTVSRAVSTGERETVEELLERLEGGEHLMAGGYQLTGCLIDRLRSSGLADLVSPALGALLRIDVTRLAHRCGREVATTGGCAVEHLTCLGEPYWNSTEIVNNDEVVEATAAWLSERIRAHG